MDFGIELIKFDLNIFKKFEIRFYQNDFRNEWDFNKIDVRIIWNDFEI